MKQGSVFKDGIFSRCIKRGRQTFCLSVQLLRLEQYCGKYEWMNVKPGDVGHTKEMLIKFLEPNSRTVEVSQAFDPWVHPCKCR